MEFDEINLKWTGDTEIMIMTLQSKWDDYCDREGIARYNDFTTEVNATEIAFILSAKYRVKTDTCNIRNRIKLAGGNYNKYQIAKDIYDALEGEVI